MNLADCYARFGGNFNEVLGRLRRESTVQKFVFKFLEDGSFFLLKSSMDDGNIEEAFRAAHTLKGVCQNLSFTKLYESSAQITEALRNKNTEAASALLPTVTEDYSLTVSAIEEYKHLSENPC